MKYIEEVKIFYIIVRYVRLGISRFSFSIGLVVILVVFLRF